MLYMSELYTVTWRCTWVNCTQPHDAVHGWIVHDHMMLYMGELYTVTWCCTWVNCTQPHDAVHGWIVHRYMMLYMGELYTVTWRCIWVNCTQPHDAVHGWIVHDHMMLYMGELYTATWCCTWVNCTQPHDAVHGWIVHRYMVLYMDELYTTTWSGKRCEQTDRQTDQQTAKNWELVPNGGTKKCLAFRLSEEYKMLWWTSVSRSLRLEKSLRLYVLLYYFNDSPAVNSTIMSCKWWVLRCPCGAYQCWNSCNGDW